MAVRLWLTSGILNKIEQCEPKCKPYDRGHCFYSKTGHFLRELEDWQADNAFCMYVDFATDEEAVAFKLTWF